MRISDWSSDVCSSDLVLALQHEDRDPLKAQLLVECDRLLVVVHDRQIDEEPAARRIMLDELAHERLADARMPGVGMDGEAPQAGTAFRVVERLDMVDAGDGAENAAGGLVFGDVIGTVLARPVGPGGTRAKP